MCFAAVPRYINAMVYMEKGEQKPVFALSLRLTMIADVLWNAPSPFDSYMFYEASSFNGEISAWNTGNVVDMGCVPTFE